MIVLLAEARIGAELRGAKDRGEVQGHGGNRSKPQGPGLAPAALSDLNIPSQRASEFKAPADAGEAAIREEVATATAENRRPSKARLIQRGRSSRQDAPAPPASAQSAQ